MAALADVFVQGRVDTSRMGADLNSGQLRSAADQSGQSLGRRFGSAFGRRVKQAAAIGLIATGAAAVKLGKDSVSAASDLGESVNAVNVTFGKSAAGIRKLGVEAAEALGLSNTEFNGLAVQFSSFATKIAGPSGNIVKTMEEMTTRAADFASVMNLDVAEAARMFQSGLAGETEPLKKFGLDLSEAAVKAHAYKKGIADAGEELTETQKVQARYSLLMQQTNKTQGDFANTSDSLANAQRRLSAQFENVKADLGEALLPVMEDVTNWIVDKGLPAFSNFVDEMREGKGTGGDVADVLGDIRDTAKDAWPHAKKIADYLSDLPGWAVKGSIGGLFGLLAAGKIVKTVNSLRGLSGAGGIGGAIGKATPTPVFVTNPGFGGPGGAPGGPGRTPPVAPVPGGTPKFNPRAGFLKGFPVALPALTFGADLPKMQNELKDLNAEMQRLVKSGGGDFLRTVALRMRGVADETTITSDTVHDYDQMMARAIRRDPEGAYDRLRIAVKNAGLKIADVTDLLPRTARAIDRKGAAAKATERKTDLWRRTMLGTNEQMRNASGKARDLTRDLNRIPARKKVVVEVSAAIMGAARAAAGVLPGFGGGSGGAGRGVDLGAVGGMVTSGIDKYASEIAEKVEKRLKSLGARGRVLPKGSYSIGMPYLGYPGHYGADYPAPAGTSVFAMSGGRVSRAMSMAGSYGKHVYIEHPGGVQTRYAHLSGFSVAAGQIVRAGQRIGAVGSTGNSTGNHLHFEYRRNGSPINPASLGIFDKGGILRHGGMALNMSGRNERILDPRQTVAFERLSAAADKMSSSGRGGGGRTLSNADVKAIADAVYQGALEGTTGAAEFGSTMTRQGVR